MLNKPNTLHLSTINTDADYFITGSSQNGDSLDYINEICEKSDRKPDREDIQMSGCFGCKAKPQRESIPSAPFSIKDQIEEKPDFKFFDYLEFQPNQVEIDQKFLNRIAANKRKVKLESKPSTLDKAERKKLTSEELELIEIAEAKQRIKLSKEKNKLRMKFALKPKTQKVVCPDPLTLVQPFNLSDRGLLNRKRLLGRSDANVNKKITQVMMAKAENQADFITGRSIVHKKRKAVGLTDYSVKSLKPITEAADINSLSSNMNKLCAISRSPLHGSQNKTCSKSPLKLSKPSKVVKMDVSPRYPRTTSIRTHFSSSLVNGSESKDRGLSSSKPNKENISNLRKSRNEAVNVSCANTISNFNSSKIIQKIHQKEIESSSRSKLFPHKSSMSLSGLNSREKSFISHK